ncbi:hypothetical protein KUV65_05210 [Maritalea mobilis]|uniref:hypothetical protein n=1 Tax=Maritalea mobilis TaxID=483324 RepID=UPI001C947EA6|nr:hypothetical protein [Maritalea mobilis]MBY6200751.1 hypothetical protein [Maritalea mobilis]
MLNLIGALLGAALGAFLAWRRNGSRLDIAQYTAVLAIIGFMLGTFAMLLMPAP